jgi:hypothetical protein
MAGELTSADFFFSGVTDTTDFITPQVFFDHGVEVLFDIPNTLALFTNGSAVVTTRGASPFPVEMRDSLRGQGQLNMQSAIKAPDGLFYAVRSVDSPTQFTLHRLYAGATEPDRVVQVARPFRSHGVTVSNDTANTIEFSYDGIYVSGALLDSESKTFDFRAAQMLFFRSVAGGDAVRLWAW